MVEVTGGAVASHDAAQEGGQPSRPWIVVIVVGAVVLGTIAVALVVYLIARDRGPDSAQPPTSVGPRWLAYTETQDDFSEIVRLDLGPGGQAVLASVPTPGLVDDGTFVTADGVEVTVRARGMSAAREPSGELLRLVGDFQDAHLAECGQARLSGDGGVPLPSATPASDTFVWARVDCGASGGGGPRSDEVYAFVTQPERRVRTGGEPRPTAVVVHASGVNAEAVSDALERAVATLVPFPDSADTGAGTAALPADPGPARNPESTGLWGNAESFAFPTGWSVVGAGVWTFVAPADAGIDAVRSYSSPGIVIGREEPRPGGPQTPTSLGEGLVEAYAQAAAGKGCSERTDLEPSAAMVAEVRWSGCPNGLVDRVLVYPSGTGGVILISVRAADTQVARDLLYELAG